MEKKKRILKASLELIVERGLHTVTFANISQRAKVGIGTIYKHFKSKDEIVQQIWIEQKKEESTYIFRDYAGNGTVKERFEFLWERVINYFCDNPLEYYFSYHFAASPVLSKEIHEVAMKDFLAFDDLYEEGLNLGMFKPLSPRHLRLYSFSTLNGWILWSKDEGIEMDQKNIHLLLSMLWDAIKK
ncbi:TetR/AcrR family transcriptional regulator [Belliella sp. DSM 107340]|uniref:TetR/AcrR family transcriptional regulator n=1 Tax=Belliella calami TaxID=2923436 RepID=A0ABS9UL73_9BACT|nr:TetR/AcrR family transcriptional regulator [Belliella calami]MCH7397185.1 TetR/AcrR family transcriptional regulator [Belliella calami]